MNFYLMLLVVLLVAAWCVESLSSLLTLRMLGDTPPEELADVYDPDAYRRSQEYTRAKDRVGFLESSLGLLLLLVCIVAGWFDLLDVFIRGFGFGDLVNGLLFIGAVGLIGDIVSVPFDIYNTFVLEERFGFNRTTPRTFVLDRIKGYALGILIGGPLLAGVLAFFQLAGNWAWLLAWAFITLVSLVLQYVAPTWILPLFNKFTPLEEGELRSLLSEYARKVGFDLTGIFVMDGSKRSAKANAFFIGFGKRKRIALFDTLLEQLSSREILAVLAHETGHYKRGHTLKLLFLSIAKTGALLFAMSLALRTEGLYQALQIQTPAVYTGLVIFFLLFSPLSLLLALPMNRLSRKFEYEADTFAAQSTGTGDELISGLKKLTRSSLSNLTPHPFDVALHYSHPPLLQRVRHLRSLSRE